VGAIGEIAAMGSHSSGLIELLRSRDQRRARRGGTVNEHFHDTDKPSGPFRNFVMASIDG